MKSGYKTTEFWLVIATNIVGVLVAFGVVNEGQSEAVSQVVAMLALAIVNAYYTNSRSKVKAEDMRPKG